MIIHQRMIINQLDKRLSPWRMLAMQSPRPKAGWVKTIRKALGMTAEHLATRLGLHRNRIVQLEHAETMDAVTLRTLKTVANAMDCEFIYAIVPRQTLNDALKARAMIQATAIVKRVAHSMALEDQAITDQHQKKQIEQLAKTLLEGSLRKLWEE